MFQTASKIMSHPSILAVAFVPKIQVYTAISLINTKHMLFNRIVFNLWKIFNNIPINLFSNYPLSEPSALSLVSSQSIKKSSWKFSFAKAGNLKDGSSEMECYDTQ